MAAARCESLHASMVTMYNNCFLAELRQHEAADSAVPAPLPQQQAQETRSDSDSKSGSGTSSVTTKAETNLLQPQPQSPKESTEAETQSESTSPPTQATQLGEDGQSAAGDTQPPKPQQEAPATAASEQQADMLAEDTKREIDSPTSPADGIKTAEL